MEPIDLRRRNRDLERRVQQLVAQNRRLAQDLDWAEEQVRVYRRLVERLVTKSEEKPCEPTT